MTKNTRHTAPVKHKQPVRIRTRVARTVMAVAANKFEKKLAGVTERLSTTTQNVRTKVVAGAKATDRAVRGHPYKAIGVAAGVGVLAGALLSRRTRRG